VEIMVCLDTRKTLRAASQLPSLPKRAAGDQVVTRERLRRDGHRVLAAPAFKLRFGVDGAREERLGQRPDMV
jgi:hypothetical protein